MPILILAFVLPFVFPCSYMGVAIAYPLEYFETVKVDVCRLSDERPDGWPREKEIEEGESSNEPKGLFGRSIIQKLTKTVAVIVAQTMQTINKRLEYSSDNKKPIDPWVMSENRFNVFLTVALRFKNGKSNAFAISNYHMPCAFFAPPVMNIHAEMAAKRLQDLAAESESKTMPYIFAGDFNILPDSPHYQLLTTGRLDKKDPTYPPPKYGVEWKPEALAMDSAYALHNKGGYEPEFTNYAQVKDDDPFIGTLDYIFLSQKQLTSSVSAHGRATGHWWTVHDVKNLPSKDESGGPFPNEKEPSDHYLIAADLELVSMNN